MNGNIVVDTNILIYFLKGYPEAKKYFYDFDGYISFVTELEILSSPVFHEDELAKIKSFISTRVVLGYLPELKDIIVKIRASKKLKLPDAIIAATALNFDIPLVPSDKAFRKIDGLKFYYHEPPIA